MRASYMTMAGRRDCDWTEDFGQENGNYWCLCVTCERQFVGHKRRVLCKLCAASSSPSSSNSEALRLLRDLRLDLTSVANSPRAEVMIAKIDAILARADKDNPPETMTPYEVADIIDKEPLIASLLYDIDLLPEQIKKGDERRYGYMLAVIGHMQAALAARNAERELASATQALLEAAQRDRDDFAESCRMQDERIARLVASGAPSPDPVSDYRTLYSELLYAVCTKYPGESRHQTAMRYIQQAEQQRDGGIASTSEREEKDGKA